MGRTSGPLRLAVIAGARPNFMKVAPLIRAMKNAGDIVGVLVHTGQHYEESMSGQFFRDLGIPDPDHHLGVGSGSHAQQTADIMKGLEPVFTSEQVDGVIVVGDVNSSVAGALVAAKLGLPVIHAEAGLRSGDRSMPEEINRIVTDSISDLLLVTEESGRRNLLAEGKAPVQIEFVGNLMIDSLKLHLAEALKSDIKNRLPISYEKFGLVTLHRPANVDDPNQLAEILSALEVISVELPLYWPMHPRTRARIEATGLVIPGRIIPVPPLGYLDFLWMQANAAVILTDSGGVQEESTVLGVPCLTLRNNTERPITVERGTNRLAGTRKDSILAAWRETKDRHGNAAVPPLWDGHAGERCLTAIRAFYSRRRLSPAPDAATGR